MLAELRDAKFAAEEQQERVAALEAAMAAATQQVSTAQQSNARLEEEVLLQSQQQQHLLDELSQSQVCQAVLRQGHALTCMLAEHMHFPHTCLLDTCISTFKHKAHSMTCSAALTCTRLTCQAAFTSQITP